MPNTIYNTLDPLFETVGLISASRNVDETRRETVKALSELGFDGERFYSTHMAVFDDYVSTFKKHYQPGDGDTLFFDGDGSGLLLLLLCLLLENRELIASVDSLSDSEINGGLVELGTALWDMKPLPSADGLDGLMTFVAACALTESEKWKLLQVMKSPGASIRQLIAVIDANIPAFEKAQAAVRGPLDKLIAQYAEALGSGGGQFGKFRESLSGDADVYPSLAFPISQLIFSGSYYYGLLSALLLNQEGADQELLLRRLKAMSDGSRLEILRSIRQKPKYNLEIAEQLGLTAATMSHHMGVLLTCGFVGVNKQDSRVYYHLEEDAVRQFIASLGRLLV